MWIVKVHAGPPGDQLVSGSSILQACLCHEFIAPINIFLFISGVCESGHLILDLLSSIPVFWLRLHFIHVQKNRCHADSLALNFHSAVFQALYMFKIWFLKSHRKSSQTRIFLRIPFSMADLDVTNINMRSNHPSSISINSHQVSKTYAFIQSSMLSQFTSIISMMCKYRQDFCSKYPAYVMRREDLLRNQSTKNIFFHHKVCNSRVCAPSLQANAWRFAYSLVYFCPRKL